MLLLLLLFARVCECVFVCVSTRFLSARVSVCVSHVQKCVSRCSFPTFPFLVCVCVRVRVRAFVFVFVFMCVCMSVCMYAYIRILVFVLVSPLCVVVAACLHHHHPLLLVTAVGC